jgi:peptidoglycan hydrolase-like protein with peptidoglycan-binding domain
MRRGLGSLLAVWVLIALSGLTLESTTALAAGRGPRLHKTGAHIKRRSQAQGASSSQARARAVRPVYPGTAGSTVRVLQRRLARAGDAPGPIDGRYGPLTERAVERFQAAHGLAVDGIAGPRTWAALSTPGQELFPTAGYYSPGGSEAVRALQRRLARAGDPPGPIDGRYGPRTKHAVRRFQAAHGLHVDGIARRRTLIDLEAPKAARRPKPASTHPRSHPRGPRPRIPARLPAPAGAPRTAVSNPQTHGSSSPAKWLVLLGILALGVVLRVRHVSRPTDASSRPPRTVLPDSGDSGDQGTVLPVAQSEPNSPSAMQPEPVGGSPSVVLAGAEGERAHPESAWQRTDPREDLGGAPPAYRRAHARGAREETGRARAAVLELQRRLHTRSVRRKR